MNEKIIGHTLAFATIFIWGVTFIFTKILLKYISPLEILIYRFLIGFCVLFLIYPKFKKIESIKGEMLFLFLGLTGVCLYYLMESIALKYTLASNVGLIMATIPMLTTIIAHFTIEDEKIERRTIYGFLIAFLGVLMIIFNGRVILRLNPIGDMLAILAAISFAIYSSLLKKVSKKYHFIQSTRKIFFYGLLFLLIFTLSTQQSISFGDLLNSEILFTVLFLGIAASALCFVMWNRAINIIGSIKSSNYIYLVPVITMFASFIVLNERITYLGIIGGVLTLMGVYISENGSRIINSFSSKSRSLR